MDKPGFEHSEAFLQWIWQNLLFEINGLETTCGKSLRIINQGSLNNTDGPDFSGGAIVIDDVSWHGDIELHLSEQGWKAHGHHTDPNYNSVILHVVADEAKGTARTENNHRPFTLNLQPYLSPKIHRFLKTFDAPDSLHCASGLRYISEDAFYAQLEKAHKEYFEQKADDFLQFYDPEKLPSLAWKHALVISIWDGLGISHNRKAMRKTARFWLNHSKEKNDVQRPSLSQTLDFAGISSTGSTQNIRWNFKAVRPASHPRKRISEAIRISKVLMNLPLDRFMTPGAVNIWEDLLSEANLNNSGRYQILYGTVFLPSLYMLGKLFAHHSLSEAAFKGWKNLKTPIPSSLTEAFNSLSLNKKSYRKKLGAIHQLRAYCKPAKCSECFVLKKAIQS